MKYWDDFQDKCGFGDGESVPPDAYLIRQVYVRELNRMLARRNSTARLLAWDSVGWHNSLLIVRVPAIMVRNVPDELLWLGQSEGGWQPTGLWHEPAPDEAYESVLAESDELELDSQVETCVMLKSDRKQSQSGWRNIADDRIRHRWDLDCQCLQRADPSVELKRVIYVEPDFFQNGIPVCEECGRDRKYVKTQMKGK